MVEVSFSFFEWFKMMLTDLNTGIGIILGIITFITVIFAIPSAWRNLKDKVFNLENVMTDFKNTMTKFESIISTKIDQMQNSIDTLNIEQAKTYTTMEMIKKKLDL